jgi:pimeloyl-ACP methyl ester carboxylesterase
MPLCAELCELTTTDGQALHGLLYTPPEGPSDARAVLIVHGVSGTFYQRPYPQLSEALARRGFTTLVANNRGHDWVARAGDGSPTSGATYEMFEHCVLDIDAGLNHLAERGFEQFALVGHSLGATKVVYYQGTRHRADVAAVVVCSAPMLFYSTRRLEQPGFDELLARAQAMVAEGRGEELFHARAGSGPGLFSARTYVNKYGPEEHTDVRPLAERVGCPLLAMCGSAEFSPNFVPYAREIAERAGGASHVIDGATHNYAGCEDEVGNLIADWLRRTAAPSAAARPASASPGR